MQEQTIEKDLRERVDLIECMISEGRRSTQSWGWTFVLWGIAYYVAVAWASWGGPLSIWGNRYYMITANIGSGVVWPFSRQPVRPRYSCLIVLQVPCSSIP